jgi:hypothetical protein
VRLNEPITALKATAKSAVRAPPQQRIQALFDGAIDSGRRRTVRDELVTFPGKSERFELLVHSPPKRSTLGFLIAAIVHEREQRGDRVACGPELNDELRSVDENLSATWHARLPPWRQQGSLGGRNVSGDRAQGARNRASPMPLTG